ncbi:hypothetical protein [Echinicola strongylocentroti]|nr:hypothetical protein [Echinicola strongylocentroti]
MNVYLKKFMVYFEIHRLHRGALGQYRGREERKRKNLIRLGVDQDQAYA